MSLVPSTEVASRNNAPNQHEMAVFQTMADIAVNSKMYKGIGEKAGVMMIMLAAREMGIPPMAALNGGLNIINGKVEISARMMNALIRKAGHQIIVKQSTEDKCELVGKRYDNGDTIEASFTLSEAQKAGLVKPGGGWTKWPKDMCFARALSRLSRQLFSDVIGIGYVEGEISQQDAKPAEIEVVEPIVEEVIMTHEEFLSYFDSQDQEKAREYLIVVMKHFSWTEDYAMKELLKDKEKLHEKFTAWKNKQGESK